VLLHGCRQTPAEFADASRFNTLADRHGFVAVYPQQSSWNHRDRCWRWYEAAHQSRGTGEPGVLAEITAQVTGETTRWRIDADRVYVAGMSAGGAMALVLAATYPDVYAAAGVHSAPAYRSATSGRGAVSAMAGYTVVPPPPIGGAGIAPTILFQGSADSVVRQRNGERISDQWLALYAAGGPGPERISRSRVRAGRSRGGRTYRVTAWYTVRGRKVLEYWQVNGLGHAWSGGVPGGSYSDPRGPRASTAMWAFFSTKRNSEAAK
jgi:poly(hydroxyalkanoate) depolymerase family esterase